MKKYEENKLYWVKLNHLKVLNAIVHDDGSASIYYQDVDEALKREINRNRLLLKCIRTERNGYTFMEYYTSKLIKISTSVTNDEVVEKIDAITVDNYKAIRANLGSLIELAISSAEEVCDSFIKKFTENQGHEDEIIEVIEACSIKADQNKSDIINEMSRKVTFALYPYGISENMLYDFEHNTMYTDKVKKM